MIIDETFQSMIYSVFSSFLKTYLWIISRFLVYDKQCIIIQLNNTNGIAFNERYDLNPYKKQSEGCAEIYRLSVSFDGYIKREPFRNNRRVYK